MALGAKSRDVVKLLMREVLSLVARRASHVDPLIALRSENGVLNTHFRNFASPMEYWKSVAALDDDAVGLEYARQNFNLSGVLVDKTRRVQMALWLLSISCVVLAIAYLAK